MEKESRRKTYNAYMREYNLSRYYRLREEAICYLGGKCIKCDSVDRLEVDHINREDKEMEVSRMLNSSLSKFWNEIKKCQLLCKSCHILKSILERGHRIAKGTHGTLSSYRYCKCELCRKARNDWMKKYRLKKRSCS